MFNAKWSTLASLFLLLPPAFPEAHCPGGVPSIHVRHIAGSLIIVPVAINHTGPYDFMLDTGSQITMLDPRLASELHLKVEGTAGIDGVGIHATTEYAHLDLIEIGLQSIAQPAVFFQEIRHLQATDPHIRGVLGGDILRHFDVLLDQDKNLLCLDTKGVMQSSIRGERISFATPPTGDGSGADTEPLIAEIHLSRLTARTLYLLVDSGANVPYLCDSSRGSSPSMGGRAIQIAGGNGPGQDFVALPAQDIPIGRSTLRHVSFVIAASHSTATLQVDGMLPTGLFRRVYISYRDHFMVLEPWQ